MRASVHSLVSSSATLSVRGGKPKPVITQNSPSRAMYTGERVTLSCGIGGDPAGWEYLWYKDPLRHTVPNTDSSRTDGSSFTISSAALAHSGEYRCRAARGRKPFYSDYSDPLTLEISVLAQTYPIVQSGWTEVFPDETVTLRCVIQGSSAEWKYKWYRDGRELPVDKADTSSVNGDTYTILSADQSHAGLYTCRGELTRRASVHSLIGSSATLTVRALPQAVVTLNEGWMGVFITKGTLAMRCELQGFTSADWNYTWYRDGTQISLNHTGERHTVGFWDSSSDGEYRCRGNRTDRPYYSLISEGFMPSHIIDRAVENVVRICVGVAVLLFLSIIVNPAFWRWVSRRKVVHSGEELVEQTDHT
ncbi:hemicentin-2-like [Anguilla anguilla]|uniref:hemicentin-2-like n=1 Tax=Anguilla anguilla TaxID=7936 RepID=UPI0015A95870|nr:hemicentin-2-like [Anguilla anguilla]